MYKLGRVWWFSVTVGGVRYKYSTETTNKKLAQKIYDKVKGDIVEGKWFPRLPGMEMTFKELKEKYLSEHSPKKSAKQCIRDRGIFDNHLLPCFGDYLLTDITADLVSAYKQKRHKEGAKAGTINRELILLKHSFSMACGEWKLLKDNPIKEVRLEKEPKGRVRYLTDEEFEKLYSACKDWLKPIVLVARHTGLRRENILSLEWSQVDLFRRVILLEQTKNEERLRVPLNETMMELFKNLSKVRHIKSSYVFCRPDGKRYVEIKGAFQMALESAGIRNFRFHDLRHCFASSLIQDGASLYEVQALLGHKDGRMTQRYAHLDHSKNLLKAVLRLDKSKGSVQILSNSAPQT